MRAKRVCTRRQSRDRKSKRDRARRMVRKQPPRRTVRIPTFLSLSHDIRRGRVVAVYLAPVAGVSNRCLTPVDGASTSSARCCTDEHKRSMLHELSCTSGRLGPTARPFPPTITPSCLLKHRYPCLLENLCGTAMRCVSSDCSPATLLKVNGFLVPFGNAPADGMSSCCTLHPNNFNCSPRFPTPTVHHVMEHL